MKTIHKLLIGAGIVGASLGIWKKIDHDKKINAEIELAVKRIRDYTSPDTTRAFDGSKVLVIPLYRGAFKFYRDRDGDKYADTYGEGFYWMGVSEITKEEPITDKINIDSLYEKYKEIIGGLK